MVDVSPLVQSEIDVMAAMELHLLITDADVTKRCMAHCLKVMQEKIYRTGGESHVEDFLADVAKLLEVLEEAKTKEPKSVHVNCSELVPKEDLLSFKSADISAWSMANEICDALEEWLKKKGFDKELDEERLRKICWEYYLKERGESVTKKKWLKPDCTYRLFLLYNKLLLRDDTIDLEVGQVNAFLMKMVSISQYTWNPSLEYKAEGSNYVNFPAFVTMVTEYFHSLHLTTDFTCELIFELYELMIKGILKKGFLEKKGHVRKNWKRRYFVLQMTTLKYYVDKSQTKFKGELVMNRHTKLLDVRDADTHTHPNKFIVTCGVSGKEFDICAEDKKTKQSWILAIQKTLAVTKMKSSSDKEEFVSSLTQWKQLVYGGIPSSPGSKKETMSLSSSPEAYPRLHCSPQIFVEFSPPYGRYVTLNPTKSPRVSESDAYVQMSMGSPITVEQADEDIYEDLTCSEDVDVSSEENTPLSSNRESYTGDIYEPFVDTFSNIPPGTTANLEEDADNIYESPDTPLAQPPANQSHLGLKLSVSGKGSAEKEAFNLYSTPTARTKLRSSQDQPGLSSSGSKIAMQQETEHLYDRPTSSRKLYQAQLQGSHLGLKSSETKLSFKTDNTYDIPKSSRLVTKSESNPLFSEAVMPEDGDSLMSKQGEKGVRIRHTHSSDSIQGGSQRKSDKRVVRVKHHISVEQ